MAEDWQVQLVRDELARAGDIGEQRSRAQLQETCGLGAGDLDGALNTLREAGEATEEAPDAWAAMPEAVREARAAAAAPAAEPEGDGGLPVREAATRTRVAGGLAEEDLPSLAEAERAAGRGAPSAGGAPPEAVKRVELPLGVADALDEAALGKIVKAGIESAKGVGASFVLVVTA